MRIIGKLNSKTNALKFAAFLTREGIENHIDASKDLSEYDIWVSDEDRIPEAHDFLERFIEHPDDPLFDAPLLQRITAEPEEEPSESETPDRLLLPVTTFFIFLCALVFFLNLAQEIPMREEGLSENTFLLTPIQASLLYDLPPAVEKLEAFVLKHEIPPAQKLQDLSPELQKEIQSFQKTPYWKGFYDYLLLKIKTGDTADAEGPLFVKIREGQVWRLFSPCVLHGSLLHILFNMIWLWVLGRPIEERIGPLRTILLTLIVGVVSNTLQYLMSGPLFLGYSGIVMGLAGFIWMRERIAPWEGYPLQKGTILFLGFFVLAMLLLQTFSFLVQIFSDLPFILNIANTAHIIGAVAGALLGRLSYFARRPT